MTATASDGLDVGSVGKSQEDRWRCFGAAVTEWLRRSGKTQSALARDLKVSTSTISSWKLGQAEPERPSLTFALERALGAPAGVLSRKLGYLPPEAASSSWEETLGLDPGQVDDRMREVLLAVIRAMRRDDV